MTSNDGEREHCGRLAERLEYRDGDLFWKAHEIASLNGRSAGRTDRHGYRYIHSRKPAERWIAVHRLIFFMHHGWLPDFIDHIDGNRANNRIANLRPATTHQNAANCKTPKTNTSGAKGVYKHADGKWQASIRTNGRLLHLGLFTTFDDAVSARKTAEEKYHGDYRRV